MSGNTLTNKTLGKRLRRYLPVYLMMLPAIIYFFVNNYMPLPGLIVAFKNYNAGQGIYGSPWVGLQNFKYLFAHDAWYITRNTIGYNLAFIVSNTVLSIAVAIMLNEMIGKMKNKYQSAILLPHLLSTVIISYLVYAFLSTEHGILNKVLVMFGADPISWYTEGKYWPFILVFVNAWKSVGYNCIIYLATIVGFNKSHFEAAVIDGATKMQQIRYITIPLLRGTIILLTLLAVGRIFYSDFGLFYQVPRSSGALFPVTSTIDTYVYRGLLELGDINMSAAASFYQSIVGFVLIMVSNFVVRKIDSDSALF